METLLEPELDPVVEDIKSKILVIDDDRDQVEILKYHLSGQGFEVVSAYCAHEGLKLLKQELPSLVLLDIDLPDATGLEVCGKICDDPETFQIPVIFVSGAERPDILRQARAAGCAFYLRKPYDPNALLVIIKQTLRDNDF